MLQAIPLVPRLRSCQSSSPRFILFWIASSSRFTVSGSVFGLWMYRRCGTGPGPPGSAATAGTAVPTVKIQRTIPVHLVACPLMLPSFFFLVTGSHLGWPQSPQDIFVLKLHFGHIIFCPA